MKQPTRVIDHHVLRFPNSLHTVVITIFRNRAGMVRAMRKLGHKRAYEADASCWQNNCQTFADDRVAELVFCLDKLSVGNIAHEAVHAVHHRLRLMGIPPNHNEYEELFATDVGNLTDAVVVLCNQHRLKLLASA